MTEIQRAKHEVSMRFWKETIMKRTASGLTIAAFCQKHGLNVHAYYYWQRQIRKDLLQSQTASADMADNHPHPARPEQDAKAEPLPARHMDIVPFAEALDMAKAEPGVAALPAVPSITIHCGKMDIDIRDGTSPELLRMVMSLAGEEATLC